MLLMMTMSNLDPGCPASNDLPMGTIYNLISASLNAHGKENRAQESEVQPSALGEIGWEVASARVPYLI